MRPPPRPGAAGAAAGATTGGSIDLAEVGAAGTAVLFIYPRTGGPGEELPTGWDLIPGARGCTPQSCAFRDLHGEFAERDVRVLGISAQSPEDQAEFAERVHLQFPVLSDPSLVLADALELPTFSVDVMTLYKRVACHPRRRDRQGLLSGLPARPERGRRPGLARCPSRPNFRGIPARVCVAPGIAVSAESPSAPAGDLTAPLLCIEGGYPACGCCAFRS